MQQKKHWKTRRKCHHQVKVPLVTFQKTRHRIWSSDMRRDKFLYFRPTNIVHYIVGMIQWLSFGIFCPTEGFFFKFLNLPIVLQNSVHCRLPKVKLNLNIVFVILFIIYLCSTFILFVSSSLLFWVHHWCCYFRLVGLQFFILQMVSF